KVAHFTKCGYKFEKWYDMIWMEKIIGEHSPNPKPFIPISELHELQL
ncbi:MAG: GNAT family N-acetyltransferase, partial [Clostridiaceae bacterium]